MAEQERIYRIKYEGVQASIESLADLRERIQAVKKAQQELDVTTEKGKLQKEELLLIEKNLSEEYRKQQKEIGNRDKQLKQEADTLEKMRARLSNMRAELEKIPIGTQAFKDQQVAVKKLQEEINGADQATARFQGNVGNYKNAIIDAFQQMGINISGVSQNITKAQAAMTGLTGATGTTSTAMKVLKIALASTGIGALIVALGSLIAYFAGTQAGIDKVNKVLEPMKQIFRQIVDILENFGGGLAKIFSGEFRAGFKEMGDAFDNIGGKMKEAANEGARIAQLTIEIQEAKNKLLEKEESIRNAMAEQREIVADQTKSDAERQAAGQQWLAYQKELLGYQQNIAAKEYEQAQLKAKTNADERSVQEELITKKNAVLKLDTDALNERRRLVGVLSGIEKKNADDKLKSIEDEKKAREQLYEMELNMQKMLRDQAAELMAQADAAALESVDLMQEQELERYQRNVDAVKESERQKIEIMTQTQQLKQQLADAEISLEMRKYDAAQMGVDMLRTAFGEQTKIGKALFILSKAIAIAQVLKEAQVAKAQLLANFVMIPPILPPGIPNPAYALAAGIYGAKRTLVDINTAMSIASIAAQVVPTVAKFAKGGIVGGRLHEQGGTKYFGEDGNQFEVERGELITVVNRYDTERLKTLSRLNATHGRPFFASGGMMAPRTDFNNTAATRQMISEVVESIVQIPVVVSEREITTSQRRVSVASKVGDL